MKVGRIKPLLCILIALASLAAAPAHPRLYFTPDELTHLRNIRDQGLHAVMYRNLIASADWCLTQPVRHDWIAPVTSDPIYENLYDRFYAIMHDMAVMEHLSLCLVLQPGPTLLRRGAPVVTCVGEDLAA